MSQVILHETHCPISFQGKEYVNQGAYVDENFANVYVKDLFHNQIQVTDWKGNVLGYGIIKKTWVRFYPYRGKVTFRQVQFKINDIVFNGRYAPDNGELVKGTRLWQKE